MKLYKYVTPNRMAIFENLQIRFTPPKSFNDPFEMRPYYEALASQEEMESVVNQTPMEQVLSEEFLKAQPTLPVEIQKLITPEVFNAFAKVVAPFAIDLMPDIADMLTEELRTPLVEGFNANIGILSLTEKPDNLLMWAHYAAQHTGFVIEFDGEHPYFQQQRSEADEFGYLRKVSYSVNRPNVVMTNVSSTEIFLTKSKEWEYEQEWRMLRPLRDAETILVDNGESIHLFSVPPTCITNVIFGSRTSDETRKQIRMTLADNGQLSHVRLHEAALDERRFQLNIHSLP